MLVVTYNEFINETLNLLMTELILTDLLPYNLVLWVGTTRQSWLGQWVLWVWKSDERVNQFLKIVGNNL